MRRQSWKKRKQMGRNQEAEETMRRAGKERRKRRSKTRRLREKENAGLIEHWWRKNLRGGGKEG